MKLQPSRRKFCVHHTTMHHVTSCKATYVTVCACLAVTCHLHFWQNDRDLLRATAVTQGWMDTEIRVSTESRPWRRKFSRRSYRDLNPGPFSLESGALTTELFPSPNFCDVSCYIQWTIDVIYILFFITNTLNLVTIKYWHYFCPVSCCCNLHCLLWFMDSFSHYSPYKIKQLIPMST